MTTENSEQDFVSSLLAAHEKPEEGEQLSAPVDSAEEEAAAAPTDAAPEETLGEEVEQDEADEKEEVQEQPEKFKVKVDGEEVEVTLEELTRSYSGNAYIQKGMQQAAAEKKAAAAQKAEADALMQSLQSGYSLIQTLTQQMQTEGYVKAPSPPDPNLAQTDPLAFMKKQAVYQAELVKYNDQQQKLSQAEAVAAQMRARQMQDIVAAQEQILHQRIPELSDPQKKAEVSRKLVDIGREVYGYSAEELSEVMDARAIHVLHDAMKWRELRAQTAEAAQSAKPTRPPMTVKPSAKVQETPEAKKKAALQGIKGAKSSEDIVAALLKANSR